MGNIGKEKAKDKSKKVLGIRNFKRET